MEKFSIGGGSFLFGAGNSRLMDATPKIKKIVLREIPTDFRSFFIFAEIRANIRRAFTFFGGVFS